MGSIPHARPFIHPETLPGNGHIHTRYTIPACLHSVPGWVLRYMAALVGVALAIAYRADALAPTEGSPRSAAEWGRDRPRRLPALRMQGLRGTPRGPPGSATSSPASSSAAARWFSNAGAPSASTMRTRRSPGSHGAAAPSGIGSSLIIRRATASEAP